MLYLKKPLDLCFPANSQCMSEVQWPWLVLFWAYMFCFVYVILKVPDLPFRGGGGGLWENHYFFFLFLWLLLFSFFPPCALPGVMSSFGVTPHCNTHWVFICCFPKHETLFSHLVMLSLLGWVMVFVTVQSSFGDGFLSHDSASTLIFMGNRFLWLHVLQHTEIIQQLG